MAKPTLIKPNGDVASSLNIAQRDCIELLEGVLASAKKGEVWSCAVVACGPSDFGTAMAGPDAARLNLGADALKAEIISRVTGKRSVLHR